MRSLWIVGVALLVGCGDDDGTSDAAVGTDSAVESDAGEDTGAEDTGIEDTGTDVSADTAIPIDAATDTGTEDTGTDSGVDSGVDASMDAGTDAADAAVCSPVDGFGDRCFNADECGTGLCWQTELLPGGCIEAGCTTPCEGDAECECLAGAAGSETPSAASCVEGQCDLSGTGLGGPIICT